MKKPKLPNPVLCILIFSGCMESFAQGSLNALQTTVPFLNITTNARIGAYGEIGTVSSSFYRDAGLAQNPALLSGNQRCVGGNMSYLQWLRNLVDEHFLFEHNTCFSPNNKNAIGYRFNYFNIGEINYMTPAGIVMDYRPYEFFHQLTYSHAFNKGLSAGAGVKYIRSDLPQRQTQTQTGYSYHAAHAYALDLGIHYTKDLRLSENLIICLNAGTILNNLGSKMKYTDDPACESEFLPAWMGIGVMINPEWHASENITLSFDMAYQAEKLLVPTPPFIDTDSLDENGDPIVLKGRKIPESVPLSWIQSFYDAPWGFEEEKHEIIHKLATEVRLCYQHKLYAAIRAGLFMEHITKGNRKYGTVGTGFGAFGFTLDTRFMLSPWNSALHNTWSVTAGYCVNLEGRAFRI